MSAEKTTTRTVVLLARTPPPLHGESIMVRTTKEALESLAGEGRIARCVHVDFRLSNASGEVGRVGPAKIFRLLRAVARAVAALRRHPGAILYYFPASPHRSAFYRDLIALLPCRLLAGATLLHWQSNGLGRWLDERARGWERRLGRRAFRDHELSAVLTEWDAADAARLRPRDATVVPNCRPDPCPDFVGAVLPERRRRLAERGARSGGEPPVFTIFYLAICTESKGLFAALEAAALLARRWEGRRRVRLEIAGEFVDPAARARFEARVAEGEFASGAVAWTYHGVVDEAAKAVLFPKADAFCLPTRYPGEAMPLVVIEALAWGLPVVTTDWKGLRSMLPDGTPVAAGQDPEEIASLLEGAEADGDFGRWRRRYEERHTFAAFRENLARALDRIP